MNFFQRPSYQSDATRLIDGLKIKNPQLEAEQFAGRARLWDKTLHAESQSQAQAARVAQAAYPYQTK